VLVPLPDTGTEIAVLAAAAARGVALDGLQRHRVGDPAGGPPAGLVLGFAAPPRAELVRGLDVLTAVLAETVSTGFG
jgi:DNA-binding transcriptional MocR family regulator